MTKNKKVLIVEDQNIIAKVYSILLTKKGYEVTISNNANDALLKGREIDPELILMDVHLNDKLTGIDVARLLRKEGLASRIIFTTGNQLEQTRLLVSDIDNCSILTKPIDFSEIEKQL